MRKKAKGKAAAKPNGAVPLKYELDEVTENIVALRKMGRELSADPQKAREFLIGLGIYTKDGHITKNYGG